MLIGYVRVSKNDESQRVDLQVDALLNYGVKKEHIYEEFLSAIKKERPQLESCLKALRSNEDTLVVWRLDRIGRSLSELTKIANLLESRNIGLKILTGMGSSLDTKTPMGKMMFSFFAMIAEYERDLLVERTKAGLKAARARGRYGGRRYKLTLTKLHIMQQAMKDRKTSVAKLAKELNLNKQTIYKYVSPCGELRNPAVRFLKRKGKSL